MTTVNISFPRGLLKAIDALASMEARSRSELLREATRLYIERKRRFGRMFAFWRAEAKAGGFAPADVNSAIGQVRKRR